jgi:hypothetical protein
MSAHDRKPQDAGAPDYMALYETVVRGHLDVLKLAPSERPCDLVLALDVLEHLPPEQVPLALANVAASTAPGGIVFSVIPACGPNGYGPEILCNHPCIAEHPVTLTFSIDDGPSRDVVFTDHDWQAIGLDVPRGPFVGLYVQSSRTWTPEGETEGITPRALAAGLGYEWAPPTKDAAGRQE